MSGNFVSSQMCKAGFAVKIFYFGCKLNPDLMSRIQFLCPKRKENFRMWPQYIQPSVHLCHEVYCAW